MAKKKPIKRRKPAAERKDRIVTLRMTEKDYKRLKKLAASGHTVIVSSHVLQEVERMASRIVAMVDGRLAAAGDIHAIRNAMSDIPYRVTLTADPARPLARELMGVEAVDGVTLLPDGSVSVQTNDINELGTALPALARDLGVRLTHYSPDDESLESVATTTSTAETIRPVRAA